jgi:NAD(P)-dependent dehydrogenase (short-subunit alcohol dehydrogenase family)
MNPGPRVALVTGGNRGLGRETVRQLAAAGLTVLLGSRREADGRAAASSMNDEKVHVVRLDVTSDADVARCAEFIKRKHGGRLDVLVNNAAIHYDTQHTALTAGLSIVREAFETNVIGAWRLAMMAATFMRPRRYGRIVNVSSGAGALGRLGANTPGYSLSKLALNGLTLMLADELKDTGILVNAVCPGWVATDMGGAGGRPVEEGARGIVWAATLPDDGPTGGFFRDGQRIEIEW